MGSVLQRKKRKAGRAVVTRKPKSKKKVLNNPIIAANWNHKETVSQNYRRLGLTAKLNRTAGGVEPVAKTTISTSTSSPSSSHSSSAHPTNSSTSAPNSGQPSRSSFVINPSKKPLEKAVSEVRVERDPNTGAILRIVGDDAAKKDQLDDPLAGIVDSPSDHSDDDEGIIITQHNFIRKPTRSIQTSGPGSTASSANPGPASVVAQLEATALNGRAKRPRQQSRQEQEWCAALVAKHGDDFQKMFWDRKLNPMQQSVGDLRKRIAKWRARMERADGHGEEQ